MTRSARSRSGVTPRVGVVLVVLAVAFGSALPLGGCRSHRGPRTSPFVEPSSLDAPTATVIVDTGLQFSPGCVAVAPGETVEWDSDAPSVAVNVTSSGEPLELYSPNLQPPLACGTLDDRGVSPRTCWRHTFAVAGCFEYFDSNSGAPGRAARDPYYGTIKFVGSGGDVTRGVVCVSPSLRCPGVCCFGPSDCPSTEQHPLDCVHQRCVDRASQKPTPCPRSSAVLDAVDGGAAAPADAARPVMDL